MHHIPAALFAEAKAQMDRKAKRDKIETGPQ
jgi:hypothetical protein